MPSKIHSEQPPSQPTMHQLVSTSCDDENPQVASNPVQSRLNFEQRMKIPIMIRRDTPPLTKLGASSATCPPFTRRSPAICPPLGMHAPRTADRARSAFNTIAPRTAAFISGAGCMVTPCGNPTPTSAARSAPSLLHWAGAATGGDRVEPRDPVPSLYVLPSAD